MSRTGVIWRLSATGHGRRSWPVFVLLALAVLAPALTLLWFANQAMESQRQLVRQRLTAAYRGHLVLLRNRLAAYWGERTVALERQVQGLGGPAAFARLVSTGEAAGAVIFDAQGRPVYPSPPPEPKPDPAAHNEDWLNARFLEDSGDPRAAAGAYARIVATRGDDALAARALLGQARCLARSGSRARAVALIASSLAGDRFRRATDADGRLIAADAELMALQLSRGASPPDVARRLRARLVEYENSSMPSAQRMFLMREMGVLDLDPGLAHFPTLEVESLSARFLEAEPLLPRDPALRRGGVPGYWTVGAPGGRFVLLLATAAATSAMDRAIAAESAPSDFRAVLSTPGAALPRGDSVISADLGDRLPGWTLSLVVDDGRVFDPLARKQSVLYYSVAGVVLALAGAFALFAARAIRRQLNVARLKADLVATVSHELKTPLASMRLLVDTLLETGSPDPALTREYLELIAKENLRLSRVIDNFLAFSRLERNKQSWEMAGVEPADIVRDAVDSVRERFAVPDCALDVEVASGLPRVQADRDALVTALLNLLDNAFKYTPDPKRISLRAFPRDGCVCFQVRDNGVGFSRREARRIFRRFYRIDQRLAREAGGCGLGLSIVEFIVNAHGGSIDVQSEPGRGSAFTLLLPAGAPA